MKIKMKKIAITTVISIFSMFLISGALVMSVSSPVITYTADSHTLLPGQTFNVTVRISNILTTDEIAGVGIKLKYDAAKIQPNGTNYVTAGASFTGGSIDYDNYPVPTGGANDRYVYVYFYSVPPVTGSTDYTFATINFKVLDNAASGAVLIEDYPGEHSEITAYGAGTFPSYSVSFNETDLASITVQDLTPSILDESGTEELTDYDTFFGPQKPMVVAKTNVTNSITVNNLTTGGSDTYTQSQYNDLTPFTNGKYSISVTSTNDFISAQTATKTIIFLVEEFTETLVLSLYNVPGPTNPGETIDISTEMYWSSMIDLIAGTPGISFNLTYDKDRYTYSGYAGVRGTDVMTVTDNPATGVLSFVFLSNSADDSLNIKSPGDVVSFQFAVRTDIPSADYTNGRLATQFTISNLEIIKFASNINTNPGFYPTGGDHAATVEILEPDVEPPVITVVQEGTAWTNTDKTITATVTDRLSSIASVKAKAGGLDNTNYGTSSEYEYSLTGSGGDYSFTTDIAINTVAKHFTVKAVDSKGNTSYEVVGGLVDKKPPVADVSSATFNLAVSVREPVVVTIPVSDGVVDDNAGIDATDFIWKYGIFADVADFEADTTALSGDASFDGTNAQISALSNGVYTILVVDSVGNAEIYEVEVTQFYPLTIATLMGSAVATPVFPPATPNSFGALIPMDDAIFAGAASGTNGSFKQLTLYWTDAPGFTSTVDIAPFDTLSFTPYAPSSMITTPGDYMARITTTKDDTPAITDYNDYKFSIVTAANIPTINNDRVWNLSDVNIFRAVVDGNLNKAMYFSGGYYAGNVTGDFQYSYNNSVDFAVILERHAKSLAPETMFEIYK